MCSCTYVCVCAFVCAPHIICAIKLWRFSQCSIPILIQSIAHKVKVKALAHYKALFSVLHPRTIHSTHKVKALAHYKAPFNVWQHYIFKQTSLGIVLKEPRQ